MEAVLVRLVRLERVGPGSYHLDILVDDAPRRIAVTVEDTSVSVVRYDPDLFPRIGVSPRPFTEAVVAFHKACAGDETHP